jgi:hypothetical protein
MFLLTLKKCWIGRSLRLKYGITKQIAEELAKCLQGLQGFLAKSQGQPPKKSTLYGRNLREVKRSMKGSKFKKKGAWFAS